MAQQLAARMDVRTPEHLLLRQLLSRQPKDHSLLQEFYLSPELYQLDLERSIFRHWHCAGHVSQIKQSGEYFLFEIDRESVIIIRGQDGEVRALANVCRHRGSRICSAATGRAKGVLVCPYHAWAYNLDGSLRSARMMPEGFDRKEHGLQPVALKVVEGLIFVSLAKEPLPFNQVEDMLRRNASPFGWADAQAVHTECFRFDANWKLALENQVECYHCGPSHPEYSKMHAQGHAAVSACSPAVIARMLEQGVDIRIRDQWALKAAPGEEADYCTRYSMSDGVVTASEDGKPLAPLMGRLTDYDGGYTVFYIGVLNHFLAYADHGVIFRYTPRSVSETELHVTWLVRDGAKPGVDFDMDRLTWLWRATVTADKRIVEDNQAGVASRYYQPGPYALPIESNTQRLVEWYLHDLAAG
jgi:phenylpropionate dioxygenase-like ring-hydroxylating dioxygenase large terminal subunit